MARARNIKPQLFKNEILGVADPLYTILFEGLWVLADREGRLEDRPLRIKGEVFPYREGVDINAMLDWLQAQGFIVRYVVGGVKCIAIVNFAKHQNPHKNESASELPSPEQAQESVGATSEKIGSARADSLNLIPDSLNLIPETPKAPNPEAASAAVGCADVPAEPVVAKPEKVERRKQYRTDEDVQTVFAYWQQAMGRHRVQLDPKRAKAIGARLADGYTVADLKTAIDGCRSSAWHMGKNDEGAVHNDIELICRNNPKLDSFIERARPGGQVVSDKFRVGSIDHSSSVAAMEESMRQRGIVVPVGDEVIEF